VKCRGRRLFSGAPACFLLAALAGACGGEIEAPGESAAATPPDAISGFRFVDVAREAGLERVLLAGRPGKDHLLDSAGTGAAWLDYDGDGRMDLYLVNGWRLDGRRVVEKGKNALYRNRGDGTFEDRTEQAGVAGEGQWGSGVAVADYDGDGLPDLLVTNFGDNVLYHNLGDGRFEDVAAQAGIQTPGWNTGAAFLDADRDGDPDLYIAGYIEHDLQQVLDARMTLNWKGMDKVAVGAKIGGDGAAKTGMSWLVMYYLIITFGELCLSPMGLSLVTKLAPKRLVGLMMGGWFLSTAIGNKMSGFISGLQPSTMMFVILAIAILGVAGFIFVMLPRLDKAIKKYGA